MSYNIAVVVPRVADDDRRAWERLDAMIAEEGPTPQVFTMLHDRLTARFPCICDLPEDQVDDGVWSDGPLRNNLGHRASVLGLVPERVDETLPFVIETANDHGLVVFDWATGKIHRPTKDLPVGGMRPVDSQNPMTSGVEGVVHGVRMLSWPRRSSSSSRSAAGYSTTRYGAEGLTSSSERSTPVSRRSRRGWGSLD
jgi:hypothetical protein